MSEPNTKPLILIVDDSMNLRKVIRKYIISRIDADFIEAENGALAEQALQDLLIDGKQVDVVVLDWMMPEFTGYEFLKKIREIDIFKSSPSVVMLTAETGAEQMSAALKYNVGTYLLKPFTQDELVNAIEKAIAARKEFKHAV